MSHQNSTEWRKIIRFMFLYFYVFQQKLKYMCLQYLSSLFPYPYLQHIIHTQQIYIPYVCVCVLAARSWTVACQVPLFMEFSKQEYWSGQPFPSPGDLPDPGTKPGSPALPWVLMCLYSSQTPNLSFLKEGYAFHLW